MKHIATIPARMGSVGFKFKNRKFFDFTADFLDTVPWFEGVIVSTDDPEIKETAKARGYTIHHRPEHLAGGAVSIKAVFENLVVEMNIDTDDILWLFFVPVLYRNIVDFEAAKEIIEKGDVASLCTFVPAETHPYDTWAYDETTRTLSQYIPNDAFRRQDKPPAWAHYHYVCCFKAGAIKSLNNELLSAKTYPVFLDEATAAKLIEVDTPEDFERWEKHFGERRDP